jgi:hypothetical protein
MNKSKLARDLGISRTMLYRLIDRGISTDSVEAAKEWRRLNLDPMQTKGWRIDGNTGVKRELPLASNSDEQNEALHNVDIDAELDQLNGNIEHKITSRVLTHVMPELWFEQAGWLGAILKDHDVKITAEQLLKTQQCLYMIYMENVIEYLNEADDLIFYAGPILRAMPGDEIYPSLMARLSETLEE